MADRTYWLDRPQNVTRLVHGLWAVCALLLLADFVVHRHGDVGFDEWWGFYGIYGFVACVGLVLAAKAMRRVVMRTEDYYDR